MSVVVCIYPTGGQHHKRKPIIALSVVDTFRHADFEVVLEQEIPKEMAVFTVLVEINFEYLKGKYLYGSELSPFSYKGAPQFHQY